MDSQPINGDDIGKLFLRITIGGLLLLHGIQKIRFGIDPIVRLIEAHQLPDWLAYGVYAGEVVGPGLMILGLFCRLGGLMVAGNMAMAVYLVHQDLLDQLHPQSGGWMLELQGLYFGGALAIVFLGAGRISLSGGRAPID